MILETSEGHVVSDPHKGRYTKENQILRMIVDELDLEYFYIPEWKLILLKID
jgi:hypothetical protein